MDSLAIYYIPVILAFYVVALSILSSTGLIVRAMKPTCSS